MWKNNHKIAYRLQNHPGKSLSANVKESFVEGRAFAEDNGMVTPMDDINAPVPGQALEQEGGSPPAAEAGPKRKRKMKKHCPVCGRRLYQDSHERWYCPRCQAEVEGERINFNYVPEDELDTQMLAG